MDNDKNGEKKPYLQKKSKSDSDWNIRPYLAMGLIFFIVFCCCILVVCILFRFEPIKEAIGAFISMAQPILYGLVIGYLMNPVMTFIEHWLLKLADIFDKKEKFKRLIRTVSSILAVLAFVFMIAMLISMVIPQITSNISYLVDTLPGQINTLISHMGDWRFGNYEIKTLVSNYLIEISDWLQDWMKNSLLPQTKDYVAFITSGVIDVFVALKNILIGLVVSIYVMCEKESFEGQTKKIIFALLPSRAANEVIQLFHTSNKIFGGFIKGKLLDSLIIGILCYIVLSIIKMPYTLLVSVIVGVTNVIPFFGPFIGAIPSTFLILLVNPLYAVYFVIFVIILQQIDGNIIGPKILGDSTGLSSFWVMFAILVGSGLCGVLGMLLGCPVFAIIYYLAQKTIHFCLRKKSLPTDTVVYIEATGVETDERKLRYGVYADDVILEAVQKEAHVQETKKEEHVQETKKEDPKE